MTLGSILPFLPPLIGALVGAVIALLIWRLGRRNDRKKTTLELYRTYYSKDFGAARFLAAEMVRGLPETDWSAKEPFDLKISEAHKDGYSEVVRFFHLLAILYRENEIQRELARKLFAREYGYWLAMLFDRARNRASWWTGPAILELEKHFRSEPASSNFEEGHKEGLEYSAKDLSPERALALKARPLNPPSVSGPPAASPSG